MDERTVGAMADQVEAMAAESDEVAAAILQLARRDAFAEVWFDMLDEAANRGIGTGASKPARARWHRWADRRARRLLSRINRRGHPVPPLDPIDAVAEAITDLGRRRVPWADVREWLMAMWDWSPAQAEQVMFDVALMNPRPAGVHLSAPVGRPSFPELDWYWVRRRRRGNR
jgi:hypothetical protein